MKQRAKPSRRQFLASPAARPCSAPSGRVVRPARGDARDAGLGDQECVGDALVRPARSSSTFRRWSRTATPCR